MGSWVEIEGLKIIIRMIFESIRLKRYKSLSLSISKVRSLREKENTANETKMRISGKTKEDSVQEGK